MTFYNVTILATEDDNGYTVTFRTREEAIACARHARDGGVFFVRCWKA